MATVTGPMLSLSASGSLAGELEYMTSRGRSVVRKWKRPANPNTAAQRSVRLANAFLSSEWSSIQTPDKQTFAPDALRRGFGNYHAYCSQNMLRQSRWTMPGQFFSPTEDDTPPATATEFLFPNPVTKQIVWIWGAVLNDYWASALYLRTDATTPTKDDISFWFTTNVAQGYTVFTGPLPPATYYGYSHHFTRAGITGPLNGPFIAIVP